MTRASRIFVAVAATVVSIAISPRTPGLTLDQLRSDAALTPEGLLKRFSEFEFKLGESVQAPDAFLESRAGDCDDFATLAADLLRARGFTPKLVVVFMAREIHVVCYVPEVKAYLDFNNRAASAPLIASDGSLADIAEKVSESFRASWHCASEFVFEKGMRKFIYTDFRQADAPVKKPRKPVVALAD